MKILFVACYSPFINNSAAIETLQYLNKLAEGNKVHLLTVDFPKDAIYRDEELEKMLDKRIRVTSVSGGKLFDMLVPRKSVDQCKGDKKASNRVWMKKLKNNLVIPDMYYFWAKYAAKVGKKIIMDEEIDVIFSMHEPPSSHWCAYLLKKEFKDIPWITYWSDPWLRDSTRKQAFFIKKKIEGRMEKKIVSASNKFIFVTEANRQQYLKDYPEIEDKSYILTRGFDNNSFRQLESLPNPELINNEKVNFIYAGEIFSQLRDINPFIKAIKKLRDENYNLYSKMNVLFFGNIDDGKAKAELEALEVVTVSPRIPFNEAMRYILKGDVLLLFGNKNSKQIPAKIYEYFGARGKIFVVLGDEKDPIKDLIKDHNKCVYTLNKVEDINHKLTEVLLKEKSELYNEPDYSFEWDSIVKRLNDILEV